MLDLARSLQSISKCSQVPTQCGSSLNPTTPDNTCTVGFQPAVAAADFSPAYLAYFPPNNTQPHNITFDPLPCPDSTGVATIRDSDVLMRCADDSGEPSEDYLLTVELGRQCSASDYPHVSVCREQRSISSFISTTAHCVLLRSLCHSASRFALNHHSRRLLRLVARDTPFSSLFPASCRDLTVCH